MTAKQWADKDVINGDTYSQLNKAAGILLCAKGYENAGYHTQWSSGTSQWFTDTQEFQVRFDSSNPTIHTRKI